MPAALPTNWLVNHPPTAAEAAQVLDAITRITNIAVMSALSPTGITASTSATYVDIAGTSTPWSKRADAAGSNVLVLLTLRGFSSVAGNRNMFAIKIGATDYDVIVGDSNLANAHETYVGFAAIPSVAAGSYTPIVRFKRVSGTGAVTVGGGDTVSFLIGELPL